MQKQRLEDLQRRIKVGFDKEDSAHQDALKQLWGFAFPGQAYSSLYGDSKWTEMGWQQNDPSTDFRGAGFIALENLLFLAQVFIPRPTTAFKIPQATLIPCKA